MRIASVNADPGIAPGRAKGAAVHLLEMREALRALGAEVVELDEPDPNALQARLAVAHSEGPLDLIYERYALGAYAAARFSAATGVPLALEVNAPLSQEARKYRPDQLQDVDEDAERALFRGAHRVYAVSRAVAEFARERGAFPDRVSIAANAVDPERFRPLDDVRRMDERRRLGFDAGTFVLGFHGRLRPWHNVPLLARATAELRTRGLDARVLAIGQGEFEAALARELEPEARVHHPWVDRARIGALVSCFDVLPLTYAPDDGFYFSPLKMLEAMSAGVPVVVPRLGDLPDWVDDGVEGRVLDAGDERALVETLAELARDPAARARMGRAARRRASAHTWARLASDVLRVAEDPVGEGTR